jgi:hypothetical protein
MPDQQWHLLKLLAGQGGELRWGDKTPTSVKANARAKIKIIRKRLRALVQIDDDPFEPYWRVKAYKTRFSLVDLSHSHEPIDENSEKAR